MKTKKLPIIKLILVLQCMCFSILNLAAQDLQKHIWENRILIIKTDDENSKIYKEQLNEFKNSIQDQIERKFVLYQVIGDSFVFRNYKNSALNSSGLVTEEFTKTMLRKNNNFEIILLGLDGGIKLRQTRLLKKNRLYEIVDSMPMRSAEIKNKKPK
ncbi:DUF4174 domain-containing protein [Aurantibacter sp.]|uniref:DUF4174 domain-containing protein n=1 Tax=Aurantibacter sp. TaxID=2807103 RepID=UPI003267F7FB